MRLRAGSGEPPGAGSTTSLAALLFSLLPFVVHHIGLEGEGLWSFSSGVMALYLCGAAVYYLRLFRLEQAEWQAEDRPSNVVGTIVFVLTAGAVGVQVLNTTGVFFEREFGPYLLGVAVLLLLSSVMFVRLLSFVRRSYE